MSTNEIKIYPFNPGGDNADCMVLNEQHVLNGSNIVRDYQIVVPRYAPFFETSLRVKLTERGQATARPLVQGIDYMPIYHFQEASRGTARPIFGGICVFNSKLRGVLHLEQYMTIGGEWTLNENQIVEVLANRVFNPRVVKWDQIVQLPKRFPVTHHTHNLTDFTTWRDVLEVLKGVTGAIANNQKDYSYMLNKLGTNKEKIGLGNVRDYETFNGDASLLVDLDTLPRNQYVTPYGVLTILKKALAELEFNAKNASKLGNKTINEILEEVKKLKVADSDALSGKDLDSIKNEIIESVSQLIENLDHDALVNRVSKLSNDLNKVNNTLKQNINKNVQDLSSQSNTQKRRVFDLSEATYFQDVITEAGYYDYANIVKNPLSKVFESEERSNAGVGTEFTFELAISDIPSNQMVRIVWNNKCLFKEWDANLGWVYKPYNETQYSRISSNGFYYFTFRKTPNNWLVETVYAAKR